MQKTQKEIRLRSMNRNAVFPFVFSVVDDKKLKLCRTQKKRISGK
jgi:hypothetical protein